MDSSECGSGAGLKVKDLDVFPSLSYPDYQRGFHVSPGEEITRGDRNHLTTCRCTSGTTPLRRLDTFSGGARQSRTFVTASAVVNFIEHSVLLDSRPNNRIVANCLFTI